MVRVDCYTAVIAFMDLNNRVTQLSDISEFPGKQIAYGDVYSWYENPPALSFLYFQLKYAHKCTMCIMFFRYGENMYIFLHFKTAGDNTQDFEHLCQNLCFIFASEQGFINSIRYVCAWRGEKITYCISRKTEACQSKTTCVNSSTNHIVSDCSKLEPQLP